MFKHLPRGILDPARWPHDTNQSRLGAELRHHMSREIQNNRVVRVFNAVSIDLKFAHAGDDGVCKHLVTPIIDVTSVTLVTPLK